MKLTKFRYLVDQLIRDIDFRIYWIRSMYRIARRLGKPRLKALIAAIRAK